MPRPEISMSAAQYEELKQKIKQLEKELENSKVKIEAQREIIDEVIFENNELRQKLVLLDAIS